VYETAPEFEEFADYGHSLLLCAAYRVCLCGVASISVSGLAPELSDVRSWLLPARGFGFVLAGKGVWSDEKGEEM
jgi:hypothetical protein